MKLLMKKSYFLALYNFLNILGWGGGGGKVFKDGNPRVLSPLNET